MNLHQTDVCRLPKPTCLTALLGCHRLSISLSLWSCPTPFNQGVIFLKLKSDHMTLLWNGLLCCCLWIKSKLLGTEPNTMWGLVSGQSWSHCLETCAIYALVILPSLEIWKIPCFFMPSWLFICYSFKKMYLFIYYFWLFWVFVAARRFSLVCSEQGLLLVAVHGLLIAVASLVLAHGL